MLHMVIEQTYAYPMRMLYQPTTHTFAESKYKSLFYERGFTKPYGWIKESGTPPDVHWDCLLLPAPDSNCSYELGMELEIKIIGVFRRNDFDHKYVVVETSRDISNITDLTEDELNELHRLYPRIADNEGWFGKDVALYCMEHHKKAI